VFCIVALVCRKVATGARAWAQHMLDLNSSVYHVRPGPTPLPAVEAATTSGPRFEVACADAAAAVQGPDGTYIATSKALVAAWPLPAHFVTAAYRWEAPVNPLTSSASTTQKPATPPPGPDNGAASALSASIAAPQASRRRGRDEDDDTHPPDPAPPVSMMSTGAFVSQSFADKIRAARERK
jgi:hypothetical protein